MKTIHIVGGGVTGCFLAFFLKDKFKVIIYEKGSQLGGLCRTFSSIEGIPYQNGFHVLSTNQQWILDLVAKSGITLHSVDYNVGFNPLLDLKYYDFPLNKDSIKTLPWHWKEAIEQEIVSAKGSFSSNLRDTVISFYGKTIYEIFYDNWIRKITGIDASEVDDVSWFKRYLFPIDKRVTFFPDKTYYPVNQGWNQLFSFLADGVEVVRETASSSLFNEEDIIILTTPPDRFFDLKSIPYIGFTFEIDSVAYDPQKPDTTIYPNNVHFLAITQCGKLFDSNKQVDGKNIIVKESTHLDDGELAYPVPTLENINSFQSNINFIKAKYKHIYFSGPLASYKHMTMAEAIESAHRTAAEIKHMEK